MEPDKFKDHLALNAMAPISRLNDDILTHIFMFNTFIDLHHIHIPSTTIRRTSQVYQRWRNLVLDYPLIWAAEPDFSDPKAWFEVVLKRARDAPLTISFPSLSRVVADEKERGILNLRPVRPSDNRDLQEYFYTRSTNEQLDAALSLIPRCRQATIPPHLEELNLYGPVWYGCPIFEETHEHPVTSSFPNLHKLKLQGYKTDLLSPRFLNLTKLAVLNRFGQGSGELIHLKADEWLKVLGRLHHLEELELDRCVGLKRPESEGELPVSLAGPPVFLHHLQTFALMGTPPSDNQILLSQIHFPASCAINLSAFYSGPYFVFSDMMDQLCQKAKSLLEFQKMTCLSLEITARLFRVTNTRHAKFGETRFSFTLDNFRDAEELLPTLVGLVASNIEDLYFHWMPKGPSEDLKTSLARTMLESFNQVTNLRIASQGTFDVIASIHQEFTTPPHRLILPKLSKLCFYKVNVKANGFVKRVIDFIYHRSTAGVPITHVLLRRCYGLEVETLETELSRIAGIEVAWDSILDPEREMFPFFN